MPSDNKTLVARVASACLAWCQTHLELNVALSTGHVEGALKRGDAVANAGPIPAAKLIALVNLKRQHVTPTASECTGSQT